MSSMSRFLSGREAPYSRGGFSSAMAVLAVRMTCAPFPSPSATAHKEKLRLSRYMVLPDMPYSLHTFIKNISAAEFGGWRCRPTCKEPPSELLFPVRHALSGL